MYWNYLLAQLWEVSTSGLVMKHIHRSVFQRSRFNVTFKQIPRKSTLVPLNQYRRIVSTLFLPLFPLQVKICITTSRSSCLAAGTTVLGDWMKSSQLRNQSLRWLKVNTFIFLWRTSWADEFDSKCAECVRSGWAGTDASSWGFLENAVSLSLH